jgi:predicted aldo/keto reductase-like oxidoreductase
MTQGTLGFGCMRLPVRNGVYDDIDLELFERMVDLFLERGFTYFDTSYVYHNGASETALRKGLIERHPRDSFTVATKLPTWLVDSEKAPKKYFDEQRAKLGVDYIDYYLLHTLRVGLYDNAMVPHHVFETMQAEKEAGRIRNLGFSFHDDPATLDRILTDHPEVDFVQIILNYYDWNSLWINSRECYETIREHGKKVVVMEPVKGGLLADPPAPKALAKMRAMHPDWSPASWAIRFAAGLDSVFVVLSGMTTYEQVEDNTAFMQQMKPLTDEERALCFECAREIRESGPVGTADFSRFAGLGDRGDLAAGMADAYNSSIIQSSKGLFAAEQNYYRNQLVHAGLPERPWLPDAMKDAEGNDVTELMKTAEDWLLGHLI